MVEIDLGKVGMSVCLYVSVSVCLSIPAASEEVVVVVEIDLGEVGLAVVAADIGFDALEGDNTAIYGDQQFTLIVNQFMGMINSYQSIIIQSSINHYHPRK